MQLVKLRIVIVLTLSKRFKFPWNLNLFFVLIGQILVSKVAFSASKKKKENGLWKH